MASSRRVATVVGYVIALFGNLACLVLSDGIYGGAVSQVRSRPLRTLLLRTPDCASLAALRLHALLQLALGSKLPVYLYAFPLFGLVRGVYLLNYQCAAKLDCYGPPSSLAPDDELRAVSTCPPPRAPRVRDLPRHALLRARVGPRVPVSVRGRVLCAGAVLGHCLAWAGASLPRLMATPRLATPL